MPDLEGANELPGFAAAAARRAPSPAPSLARSRVGPLRLISVIRFASLSVRNAPKAAGRPTSTTDAHFRNRCGDGRGAEELLVASVQLGDVDDQPSPRCRIVAKCDGNGRCRMRREEHK